MGSPKMVSRKELEDQIHRKRTGKSIMQGIIDAQKAEIDRLRAVAKIAADLVSLWRNQKIQGVPRAERNAAIEDTRSALVAAVDQLSPIDTGEPK